MFSTGSKKPYSAISVHVERLTSETYEEDDLAGVPDLIEVVRLQATGPSECARSLRKKLKYGSVHRQLRALTILDGVLQNGGTRVQRPILSDGPLLERLRIAAVDPISDPDVRAKCKVLFGQWMASSKDNPGLEGAKALYNQLPKQKAPQQRREQSKVLRETEEAARRDEEEDEDETRDRRQSRSQSIAGEGASSPAPAPRKSSSAMAPITLGSSSTFGVGSSKKVKKDKKGKLKIFNLEKEKPAILQAIAGSSVASTNLNNALKLVNRESRRVSNDPEVMKRFETCKQLRRQILRYIHLVNSEEFLGGLIHANEELVVSLMAFEVLDKSVDDDSDSEMEEAAHLSRQEAKKDESALKDAEKRFADLDVRSSTGAAPAKPPRPGNIAMPARPAVPSPAAKAPAKFEDLESESEGDDSDDPFGDSNVINTPGPNKGNNGFTWKEV